MKIRLKNSGIDRVFFKRNAITILAISSIFVLIAIQLVNVQFIKAKNLREQASNQRTITEILRAVRGSILDSQGRILASTKEEKSLTFQPKIIRDQLDKKHEKDPSSPTTEQTLEEIASYLATVFNDPSLQPEMLAKLNSDNEFVYLIRNIDPTVAAMITNKYPEIGAETVDVRQYPAKSVAGNIIGVTKTDGKGLEGLELSEDALLSGLNGREVYDQSEDGEIIPGSVRDYVPAKNGDTIKLNIDEDLQYFVQQQLEIAKQKSGATLGEAVVLNAKTGQIMAMANTDTFDPANGPQGLDDHHMLDPEIQDAFEPGSVNKIVTASGLMQYNLAQPAEVLQVPETINTGGITVHDAWPHGVMPYTVQGIFSKSSNVGTLMLVKRLGKQRFYDLAKAFGIGDLININLGGESAGNILPIQQWSGASFANFPIGQGLSMTLLQMTSMYQTIANGGERIVPTLIKSITKPDGTKLDIPQPKTIKVIDPQAAKKVLDMFRGVIQKDPWGYQQGSGSTAAVPGYQISGKTGTAQIYIPSIHRYSNSDYNITFAGIAPTNDPRFVIGLMLRSPKRGSDGSAPLTDAPLFHTIASWMLNHYNVPLSPSPSPWEILQAGVGNE